MKRHASVNKTSHLLHGVGRHDVMSRPLSILISEKTLPTEVNGVAILSGLVSAQFGHRVQVAPAPAWRWPAEDAESWLSRLAAARHPACSMSSLHKSLRRLEASARMRDATEGPLGFRL